MQLMALNALLLFDAIFIFFLFLVSVSCLLYYLPLVPPTRSSSLVNMEDDVDLESALVESSQSSGGGGQTHHPHYCHHVIRERGGHLEDEDEGGVGVGGLEHSCGSHYEVDQDLEENDPCPTANPSPMHRNFNSTPIHNNINHNHQQDHPATHIIMTPPQRYQSRIRDKGQPYAKVETV